MDRYFSLDIYTKIQFLILKNIDFLHLNYLIMALNIACFIDLRERNMI